jgi:hypothetical protein
MPVTESVGKNRVSAFYRVAAFLLWMFVLSWSTLTIAFVISGVWAVLNFAYMLVLNDQLMWGKAWAKSTLAWNYQFLYYGLGLDEFPGWMGWMP